MTRSKLLGTGLLSLMSLTLLDCTALHDMFARSEPGLATTSEILLTSAAGNHLAIMENMPFQSGKANGVVIRVMPDSLKQTIDGIGTSFTESSAFVLAHLDPQRRRTVMQQIYGGRGANFTLARTHIGACDFSVEGKYSYADTAGDTQFNAFSISEDLRGFDPEQYPGIKDASYDLLPMIREANEIKRAQGDSDMRIIASAWTAPAWMKDIEDWYQPGSAENNWQGTGGSLKPEYVSNYSNYLLKYLQAYRAAGVDIWGLTPVNEPHGNNGQWESMNFSPESQSDLVQSYLGPGLRMAGFQDTKLLIYDQNRDGMEHWAEVLFPADKVNKFIYGVAVHWYESTNRVYEEIFDRVQTKYPQYTIVHTEGCIDDLGRPAPEGCSDPSGRTEKNWFKNDDFWWNKTATDWAYGMPWAGAAVVDHPMYTPVHRYARNIIVSLDHWATGWVDWNIVLDQQGGPNHADNFCGAPIMIDTRSQDIYYTPIYYVLAQFSRTIRPGDRAVKTHQEKGYLKPDDLHACATLDPNGMLSVQVLNTTRDPIHYSIQIAHQFVEIEIPENAVQTVRIQL